MYLAKFNDQFCAVADIQKTEFAEKFPLLDRGEVHARWKKGSWQITRIGDIWKRTGKIFSVHYDGADAYPSFQFDVDGTPLPLMEEVLKALPPEMTQWQRAFWMTSPVPELDGGLPIHCIRSGDRRVIEVAAKAGTGFLN
ncbi:hypothetical protein [Ruegeria profundi]|uniref:hypothetical protein n=1 Tax=Ruegeria profundi TaxID=1685378 RepID=UPI001CD6AAFF|nr:hypothetical protein [Ruegeria profundi]MCA0928480.1 hypothetical protein [Ruegeria profundi]